MSPSAPLSRTDAAAGTPHVFESAYYSRLSELERRHWWGLGMRAAATRTLDRIVPAGRTWRVFDAGCGTGLTLAWLRRYTDVPATGLDYAGEALRYCAASGHRRLVRGTATALPVVSDRFDLAVSMDVMQHLPRPGGDAAMLAEITRILKPGGWFFLRTNSRCGYEDTHVSDYHRYRLAEVRTLLAAAGLQVESATYANCIPGLLATVRQRFARQAQSAGDPGLFMVPRPPESSPVVRLMYWLLLAESIWIGRWGLPLPFGHSILAVARKPGTADDGASPSVGD